MARYFGNFKTLEDVKERFEAKDEGFPTDQEILFAAYADGDYSGDAKVIYYKDKKLYEVNGSHCSCMGLEGQWEPEETSWAAIAMRPEKDRLSEYYDYSDETRTTLNALIDNGVKVSWEDTKNG